MVLTDTLNDTKSTNMSFLKHQYRTSLGITWDILQACMYAGINGISVSRISQKANLSHSAVVSNCQRLVDAGMIRPSRIKRKYIFTINEKGIKFFYELEKFHDIVKEINIRYWIHAFCTVSDMISVVDDSSISNSNSSKPFHHGINSFHIFRLLFIDLSIFFYARRVHILTHHRIQSQIYRVQKNYEELF